MSVSEKTAQALSKKLQTFRGDLNADEQFALDSMLHSFGANVRTTINEIERLDTMLGRLKGAGIDADGAALITPTITTITITTTLASHPIIGCFRSGAE